MILTRELAVVLHRKCWNWIADETERRQQIVNKEEYPLFKRREIEGLCWCCQYIHENNTDCRDCLISWEHGMCRQFHGRKGEYGKWFNAETWQEAAYWARVIANLPERRNE